MKKVLAVAAFLALTVAAQAQGWFRQPTPNDTLQSVRVLPNGDVLFQIYAPKARAVAVTGDLPWDKPVVFKEAPNGVWKGVCTGLADGCFRYSFIVDGTRVQDPKAPLSAEQASVFTQGGPADIAYRNCQEALGYLKEAGINYNYLENEGSMPADEVVQLYVSRPESQVEWPAKDLKAFQRVSLNPGETQTVTLTIPVKDLRFWNEETGAWDLEHGKLQILVGSASDDIRQNAEVTI